MKTVINNKEFWLHNGPLVNGNKWALRPVVDSGEFLLFVHNVRFMDCVTKKIIPREK